MQLSRLYLSLSLSVVSGTSKLPRCPYNVKRSPEFVSGHRLELQASETTIVYGAHLRKLFTSNIKIPSFLTGHLFLFIGHLCPSTHPYPCKGGRMCSKSVWKPSSGGDPDCDGRRLTEGSICCPEASNLVECNGDAASHRCREYDPGTGLHLREEVLTK